MDLLWLLPDGFLFHSILNLSLPVVPVVSLWLNRHKSQPLTRVRDIINPILRGWVQYFKIGNSSKVFGYVEDWLTRKIRRHLMKAKGKWGKEIFTGTKNSCNLFLILHVLVYEKTENVFRILMRNFDQVFFGRV